MIISMSRNSCFFTFTSFIFMTRSYANISFTESLESENWGYQINSHTWLIPSNAQNAKQISFWTRVLRILLRFELSLHAWAHPLSIISKYIKFPLVNSFLTSNFSIIEKEFPFFGCIGMPYKQWIRLVIRQEQDLNLQRLGHGANELINSFTPLLYWIPT